MSDPSCHPKTKNSKNGLKSRHGAELNARVVGLPSGVHSPSRSSSISSEAIQPPCKSYFSWMQPLSQSHLVKLNSPCGSPKFPQRNSQSNPCMEIVPLEAVNEFAFASGLSSPY